MQCGVCFECCQLVIFLCVNCRLAVQGPADAEECKHELWPMVSLSGGQPIPGVFACRRCYFDQRNTPPTLYTKQYMQFTSSEGSCMLFKPSGRSHYVSQHHL